jgi:predicted nucleic acid-binding protein
VIVLDTNVISEVMRGPRADPAVLSWLRSLPTTPVTTVINRAEVLAGIALLPHGQRRERLGEAARAAFSGLAVCLPLSDDCVGHYAEIVAVRSRRGRPIGAMDALIAAIVRDCAAQLATGDERDFTDLGIDVINPWTA